MKIQFDRGTIVCSDLPDWIQRAAPPGLVWDPRTKSFRAPAHRYPELRDFLRGREIRFTDQVSGATALAPERNCPPLRPYQDASLQAWDLARRRGIVALPTGSGKTRVALAAIAHCGVSTLCMVPTRILLAQWHRELTTALAVEVGCYGDGERDLAPVTVATFESAYRHMHRLGNRFGLLVVDEAHHFGSGLRDEALEMCTAPWRLGLTATPPCEPAARSRLERLLGPAVYRLAIADLTGGYLAEFEQMTLTLNLGQEERALYDTEVAEVRPACRAFFARFPAATWRDFVRESNRTSQGRRAIAAWRRARRLVAFCAAKQRVLGSLLHHHRDARVLVFTADNESAYAIARRHLVMPITCDIGRKERAIALERFGAGKLRVLVSARVLNEGFDVPSAEVAVIVGGGQSERQHVQRVGRLLRPAPNKRALIYELVIAGTHEVAQARRRRRGLG